MAVVNVIAKMDGEQYQLDNSDGTYELDIAAPDESTTISVTATDESGNSRTRSEEITVSREWLPPKTDWTATDYFNAVDYNRIIGNLAYLSAMANELYETEIISLGQTKDYTSMIYAREINAIENALEKINLETVNLDIGDKSTFVPNGRTPPWTEFNRIENACLLLNKVMVVHKKSLSRLAFKLGKRGVKF